MHLATLCGTDAAAVLGELARQPSQAHLIVRQAVLAESVGRRMSGRGGRLVLIVDQFEQLFTLSKDEGAEGQAFITALCAAANNRSGPDMQPPSVVIIVVRGDFWDRCAAYPEIAGALRHGQFVVGPMTDIELRLAITGPAEAAGLRIEPVLADTILSELHAVGSNEVGILPLLSQAMLLTWHKREGDWLTSRGYGQSGGVSHAVETSADSVYDALPTRQQVLAQQLFRAMTVASRDGRLTRRPVSRISLYSAVFGADPSQVDAVLEAFADQRLIVLDGGTAQISHEALLTAWPRLRGWLEDDQASWTLHAQLSDDAAAWDGSGKDASFLYRGTQLAAFRQAVERWQANPDRYPALTGTQRAFLDAGHRSAARSNRQRQILTSAFVLLLIMSLAGAAIAAIADRTANHQRDLSNQRRDMAVSGQLATQSEALDATDPITASLLAAAAAHFDLTPQVRDSLLDVATQPERAVLTTSAGVMGALAFSPNGKILATPATKGVALWDVNTRSPIGPPLGAGNVNAMAFSPDGKTFATADQNGIARLWNVATHHEIGAPLKTTGNSSALAYRSDNPIVATVTGANYDTVRIWDLANRRLLGTPVITNASIISLALSRDGTLLGIVTANGSQEWNLGTGNEMSSSLMADGVPDHVTFSPNSKVLAAVNGGSAVLSRAATGQPIGSAMPVQSGMGELAAFSADGTMLATGGGGTSVTRLWNVADQRQIGIFQAGASPVWAMAFSPAGTVLATGNQDGQIQLWDFAIWRQIGVPLAIGDGANNSIAISPGRKILAVGESGGRAQLWDLAAHHRLGELSPGAAGNNTSSIVAFSPDGKILAIGDGADNVQLWSIATRRPVGPPLSLGIQSGYPTILAFSPDGKILAGNTAGAHASTDDIQLLNVATGRTIGAPLLVGKGTVGQVGSIAFSAGGKTLATTTSDTAQLWDVVSHRQILTFKTGHPWAVGRSYDTISATAFSSDGKSLATLTGGSVQQWDMINHRQVGAPLNLDSQTGYPTALAFSPDGKTLAVATLSTVELWDIATHQQIGTPLTANVGRNPGFGLITFSPDGKTLAVMTQQGVLLWDVSLPRDPIAAACSIAGRQLTRHEWKIYIPSEPFENICK